MEDDGWRRNKKTGGLFNIYRTGKHYELNKIDTSKYMNDLIRKNASFKTNKQIEKDQKKEKYFDDNFTMKDEDYSKDYIFYGSLGYERGVDKKDWNEKEKAVDYGQGMRYKQIVVNEKKTGKNVARLWYKEVYKPDKYMYDNKIWVSKIEVHPDYRRKGIATQMYKELQRRAGNEDIYFGELTPQGKRLLENIATITNKKEMKYKGKNYDKYWGRINK